MMDEQNTGCIDSWLDYLHCILLMEVQKVKWPKLSGWLERRYSRKNIECFGKSEGKRKRKREWDSFLILIYRKMDDFCMRINWIVKYVTQLLMRTHAIYSYTCSFTSTHELTETSLICLESTYFSFKTMIKMNDQSFIK